MQRRRHEVEFVQCVEIAVMRELRRRPQALYDAHALAKARMRLLLVHAEATVLVAECSAPEAHIEPPAAHAIQRRRVFRKPYRIMQRGYEHPRAQPNALGARCDGGRQHQRRRAEAVAREVMLRNPNAMKAKLLAEDRLLHALREQTRRFFALRPGNMGEKTEFHADSTTDLCVSFGPSNDSFGNINGSSIFLQCYWTGGRRVTRKYGIRCEIGSFAHYLRQAFPDFF